MKYQKKIVKMPNVMYSNSLCPTKPKDIQFIPIYDTENNPIDTFE